MSQHPAPAGLSDHAAALWDGVTSKYALRIDELYVLEEACRELDLIAQMVERQRVEDLIGRGSMGQDVVAPLVSELRQHRSAFAAFMRQLKLPDEPAGGEKPSASESARHAANARWGNVPG
jgi:hypothetical protein